MTAPKIIDISTHPARHKRTGEERSSAGALIDLHSHILPGLDDGARSIAESIQMLRLAASDGIRIITATPHAARIQRDVFTATLQRVRAAAREADLDIAILPGSEVRLSADLGDRFSAGKLVTLNDTNYVLVELPFERDWSPLIHPALYGLQLAGAIPVIAHAERYPAVQRQPAVLLELVEMGAVIQVNADSLLGADGRASRRAAEIIVRAGVAHIIATDAHRIDQRRPLLRAALDRVTSLTSRAEATRTQVHAAAILQGRTLALPDPNPHTLHSGSRLGFSQRRL